MYDAILFPTDGSKGAERAREHAIALADDQGATLHVVHAVEVVSPGISLQETLIERKTERGEELVAAVAEEARARGVDVETAVLRGDPARAIVEYATDEGVDLVVMPTHGRPELSKALMGSVTDKVVRTGDVPVLVVRFET